MRYTTLIAINELQVYQNTKARLVYLHLALTAGYHDNDRDLVDIPLRRLADDCGITLSALRHALLQLERAGLVKRTGSAWSVLKWLPPTKIAKRKESDKSGESRKQEAARLEEKRQADILRRAEEKANNTSGFIMYYENQVKLAKNGDNEAMRIITTRRTVYIKACENANHKPIEI